MRDKIKLSRVISSWKSERKLWLKFQLNQSIFLFLPLKLVIVNFGFLNLFFDIWIQNPDPDSEYGSGSRIQAQIECGSNRIRIRNTAPRGFEPGSHVTGSKHVVHWTNETWWESCEIARSPQFHAKNASFHKKNFKAQRTQLQLLTIKYFLVTRIHSNSERF